MSPRDEYARRLQAREAAVACLEKLHVRIGYARLLLAIAAAMMAWWSFGRHVFSPWWLAAPLASFVAVAASHARVLRAKTCAERGVAMYHRGIARIEDRWAGTGETGERFNDPHHVYACDLDLFGTGSLFELLSTARTRMGEATLAHWLLSPSAVADLRERHSAVSELRERLDLREDLAVLGEDARTGVHPDALLQWAEAPERLTRRWIRAVAVLLGITVAAGVAIWFVYGIATPLAAAVVVEAALWLWLKQAVGQVLHGTEHAFEDMELLSAVLARIEHESFAAPRMQGLAAQLRSRALTASRAIAKLRTIVNLIDSRENLLIRMLDLPLMYSVQVAFAAEAWRRVHGHAVRRWIDVVGEIEALLSMAGYSYEHPDDSFPEFAAGTAALEAQELGHPLILSVKCVRNDVRIQDHTRVLLVSGSNMSGKSTLLRAVGINTVLAMAGAPVRARRFRLTPLQVGASIRINDSLQEGSSRFYAEITRLRRLFDLAAGNTEPRQGAGLVRSAEEHRPLLFLLDELLQGTNSRDRRIGAEGIVRALVERGAIGLVTTHDLALTDIAASLDGQVRNVHFQDELEDGRVEFDYRLREGVVAKSNGLELMRSVGLDV